MKADRVVEMRQWQYDELKKIQEALYNSLLLAEDMLTAIEAVCPFKDLPGNYQLYGLATIRETLRLHKDYENMAPVSTAGMAT